MEVPGDTPMFPVAMVVNPPLNAIEVPANMENPLHVPSMPGANEELDEVPNAEAEAEAAAPVVNNEGLEGNTSTTDCVSDGDSDGELGTVTGFVGPRDWLADGVAVAEGDAEAETVFEGADELDGDALDVVDGETEGEDSHCTSSLTSGRRISPDPSNVTAA